MIRLYRTRLKCGLLLAALGLAMMGLSSASAQFIGPPPEAERPLSPGLVPSPPPTSDDMSLLPGDLFEVQVFGIPQFDYKGRIDEGGNVALPMVGTAHLGGDTVIQAEAAIAARLIAAEYVKSPQVILHVLESPNRVAVVTGEVKSPGAIPIYGEKHLLDLLAAAGGLTPASSPRITIYRRGTTEPFQVELPTDPVAGVRSNIVIYPGDNIVVSKVGVVYMIGALHTQGAIPLKSTTPLTLIEALSLAGGVNYEAAAKKAYILRVSADGRTEIPFDVAAVLKHRSLDRPLQSDDIVLVPTSTMKAALKGGAAGVAASLLAGVGYITIH